VAAGMIADAVRSHGRSRHGHLTGAAMTVAVRAVGNTRRPRAPDEKWSSHIYLQRPTEKLKAGWLEIRSAPDISGEGEHPALGLFPSLFPLARCHVFGFVSLRTGLP